MAYIKLATINQKLRFIEFNATSNQRNGLIEYALVHENGKVHESKIRPQILHSEKRFLFGNPKIIEVFLGSKRHEI